ncbi:hypothetical protein CONLIGDRAFT_681230 [Coniochaeta ligniaria NRRL 30616]|uniref:Uncharacterized protein n=1 Tax=Coniochaeta ligniaria NRRL 30616 TaxID=1408157 RepID=A0A1J7JKR7_9PEZI|nr:hypothetical protein CONLIGDRAFT_681230 [Coniochaeta ligniaria NRRL 30616]
MLTTTATRRTGTSGSVVPTCAALIRYRNQQNRTFRFARIWASCLDPEPHREVFGHHRKLRHKYAETLNRRLSWDNHPYADDAKRMLKSSIRDCWKGMRATSRYVNTGPRCKTPDNPTGVRPGNNIEDAERGAMEHLLFGNSTEDWPCTSPKYRGRARNQGTPSRRSAAVLAEGQSSEVEYTIDPITNRKVPKTPKISSVPDVSSPAIYSAFDSTLHSAADIPATPLKGYEPQFTPFNPPPISDSQEPIFYDGPPPEAELKKYGPVRLDPNASKSAYDGQPNPVFESEEYEKSHAKPSENSVSWHSNHGIMPTAGSISGADGVDARAAKPDSFGYEDLDKYIDSTPTHKRPYDDLKKYKPVALEEDDVDTLKSPQQYSDLSSYDTFTYLEPDGRPAAQELTDADLEVQEYQQFVRDQEDGRVIHDESRAHPSELGNYKPFGYNEPDGKPMSVVEESNDYDPQEVQQYQAFRYNEPDGKPELATEEGNDYDPLEVQKYQAFRFNEPDGKPLPIENTDSHEAAASREYQEIRFAEGDAGVTESGSETSVSELQQYGSVRHNEPDGKPSEQLDSTAKSLDEFDRKQRDGRQIPYLEPTEEERAEDLDLLRASDVRASFARMSDAEHPPEMELQNRDLLESLMSRHTATSDAVDQEAAASVREAKRRSLEGEGQRSEQGRQLTGNYVRDFPDEFTGSWAATFRPEQPMSSNSSADVPLVQPALDRQNKQEPLQPALDRQAKLEPRPAVGDLFSKEPQGLETSYAKECAATLDSPIFVAQYGDIGVQPESTATATAESPASSSEPSPEPTLYKILAYDQTMQTINTAETTSNVSKTEPPLTPAEVLLRLSNPAKFFPHFGPLQAQGFEIVSGSGDVLVFRKVRDPEAEAAGSTVSGRPEQPRPAAPTTKAAPLVNPIDMTGSKRNFPDPAIGRFASPTGFVNYDMPAAVQQQQGEPPAAQRRFVSGIDVRREEPVFSGERKGEEKATGTKASLPKRMAVGAAWVAGVSYALGVMGEYFTTGGADGKGPKGF